MTHAGIRMLPRQRLVHALLLLQSLALAAASSVWQPSFPAEQRPRSSSAQQQQSSTPTPTPTPPPTVSSYNESTALYLAHVTSVSYCQEDHIVHWNCGPCGLVPPLEGVKIVEDTKDNFQGLVGYSRLYDAVVVAYRGSMDVSNWLDNLTFLKRRAYAEFPGVMVHEGFYWAYRSVAPQVLARLHELRKLHPHASLMVAGHSLGGAVAAICAFELEYIEKIPVEALYTFGKPRVGNTNFSARLRNASMEVYRVTHFEDAVPHLPPTWTGFEHTTEEVRGGAVALAVACIAIGIDAAFSCCCARQIFYDEFSATCRKCSQTDGEDPSCSNTCSPFRCTSIVDHLTYLNITMSHLIC
jgi:hypothetical protein